MKKKQPVKEIALPDAMPEKLEPGERAALELAFLQASLAAERVERLKAQLASSGPEAVRRQETVDGMMGEITAKYKLGPKDKVEVTTGVITRAAAAPEPTP